MAPECKDPGGNRGLNPERSDQVSAPSNSGLLPPSRQDLRARLVAHALPFLATLNGCSDEDAWTVPVTFQVFDDSAKKDRSRARIIHGCLDDLGEQLEEMNVHGDGIFITPNQTDLRGRKKDNISGLRAAWSDIDDKNAEKPLNLDDLALPPTMVVRSGHGSHLYWVFEKAIPCDERRRNEHEAMLRGIQKSLAPYGADVKVCPVQSVLRMPGYYNMKREPVLVEVLR